ncbi:MAG: histidine kinase [Bacteroidota bacterium]
MKEKYHLLYVDDEEDNLFAFKAVFRRYHQVSLAVSGKDALELLENKQIDILISDQRMPSMTGVELLEIVRKKHPDIIRMILTGYSDMNAIIDSINKGKIYHSFTKPWDFEEVKIVIDNALETMRLRQENAQLQLRNTQLEKANVLSQIEVLKEQLNPHFLFNCINILTALIPQDSERAVTYTNNFAKLYRKLLEVKDQTIVSLEQELEFTNKYISLQKTRFEDSLIVKLDIPNNKMRDCLPPFTLQLLVENAIKHNIISSSTPLTITIEVIDNQLIVSNVLQERKGVRNSTGIGLNSLIGRYKLLTSEKPTFQKSDDRYIASVPLVEAG